MFKRHGRTLGICAVVAAGGLLLAKQALLYGEAAKPPQEIKEVTSYRDIVRRVLPAVVSIEVMPKTQMVSTQPPAQGRGPLDGLPEEFRRKFEEFQAPPGVPRPGPGRAFGSGFVVDPKGIVLTNDHVVRNAGKVQVTLQDGRKFTARDIKRDPKTDLAIVRLDAKEPLPYLELGNSAEMEIGDRVLAIGAPLGMTGTVTSGIISAKGRDIHLNMYEDFLQTDAAINPGNSGGPLVNLNGQVIGVNSVIKSETGGFQGIGLAISSNLVKNVMAQLLKDGLVHRGYLGVQVQALDPEVASRLGIANRAGVVVSKVTKGAPAARAGLLEGDIVTAAAGQPVKDARELQRIVAGLPAGKAVELAVIRDGAPKTLSVTLAEQPRELGSLTGPNADSFDNEATTLDRIGVKIGDMTPQRAKAFGFPEKTEGVVITEVEPNGMAAEAGLRHGTLIVKVDQVQVRTTEEAQKALEKGSYDKGVLLQVQTPQGGTNYVVLKAAAAG
jgi:serine protease Do